MKIFIPTIIALLLCFANSNLKAQTWSTEDVSFFSPSNINTIMENDVVKGYYSFLFMDRVNRKNSEYQLNIFDNNLKITHTVEMERPKYNVLMDGQFNGTHFCFAFLDQKDLTLDYVILDKTGEEVASYKVGKKLENKMSVYVAVAVDDKYKYLGALYAVPGKGFLRLVEGDKKQKGNLSIELFDNSGIPIWEGTSGVDGKLFGEFNVYDVTEDYVALAMTVRPKAMSMADAQSYINIYSTADGSMIGQVDLTTSGKYLVPSGATLDNADGSVVVFGEYYGYKANGKPDLTEKVGFFLQNCGSDGKVLNENYSSWAKDVAKIIRLRKGDRLAIGVSVMMHKIIKTGDGKIYAIGEQYKKAVSGGTIALAAAGAGSAAKIELHNMMIFEFSTSLELTEIHTIKKDKTNFLLPRGIGLYGEYVLGYYTKLLGGFEYMFTTIEDGAGDSFNSVYVNYDRTKDRGQKYVIGNMTRDEDGEVTTVKINLDTNPTYFWVMPAKPGYCAVIEYFRKGRKVSVRLEKLDV